MRGQQNLLKFNHRISGDDGGSLLAAYEEFFRGDFPPQLYQLFGGDFIFR